MDAMGFRWLLRVMEDLFFFNDPEPVLVPENGLFFLFSFCFVFVHGKKKQTEIRKHIKINKGRQQFANSE